MKTTIKKFKRTGSTEQRAADQKKMPKKTQKTQRLLKKPNGFSEKPNKSHTETESESDIESVSEFECETETDIESVSECECKPDGAAHTHTKSYGENKNVILSDEEYERLTERMGGSKRSEYIEKLSDYMASTGKKYQSHYATICSWFRQDGGQKPSTSFDMDEIIARGERLPVYEKKIDSS